MSSLGPLLRLFTPVLLALLCLAPLQAASPPRDWNLPARDWYEGPVRYLITREEEKKFRALITDGERAAFIEDFWARRDADPATPANEFEIRFWKRVEEADHLFRDAPYPGWKTDRGKLYVLLGAPDEIREELAYGRRGKEVPFVLWTYHQPRFEGMERDTEIRFQKDESGEFQITDRIFLSRLEWLSGVARNLIYGAEAAQRPPEPRQILDTIMASRPPIDSRRFRTHYDFFKAADGSTSVVLTLGIRVNPPGPPVSVSPPPQTAPADTALALEWQAIDHKNKRFEFYRRAGDRYLEENDVQAAVRCYKGALAAGSTNERTISVKDNWLLMAIKEDWQKEKRNETNGG